MPRSPRKVSARRERRAPLPEPEVLSKEGKSARGRTTASTTPLVIRTHGVDLDDATRTFAHERAGFKLAKFALYIEQVTLHVDNVSRPTGTPAIACRAVISAAGFDPIVVESESRDVRDVIEQTLERSERSVRRAIERRQGK